MYDVIVVGSGIVGATIAEAFRQIQNRDVLVLDSNMPMSGTWPSGGSVKPSPLTGLSSDQLKPSLDMLDRIWGLHKEQFAIKPIGGLLKADVYQIPIDKVFHINQQYADVQSVTSGMLKFKDGYSDENIIHAKLIVVAAGMGSIQLIPELQGMMSAKQGVSFHFNNAISSAFVQTWAPYKQITVHNISIAGDIRTWASDGTALKPESWTDQRTEECMKRCMHAMQRKDMPLEIRTGYRSFHSSKAKPLFLKEVQPSVWVATGAGKFGCIAAGWAASELLRI